MQRKFIYRARRDIGTFQFFDTSVLKAFDSSFDLRLQNGSNENPINHLKLLCFYDYLWRTSIFTTRSKVKTNFSTLRGTFACILFPIDFILDFGSCSHRTLPGCDTLSAVLNQVSWRPFWPVLQSIWLNQTWHCLLCVLLIYSSLSQYSWHALLV